jgi:Rieske Fe-S protein
MKLEYSLVTRRTFLNTLLGGWLASFAFGSLWALCRFAFPTLGREPDYVVLAAKEYLTIPANSAKVFAWGGKAGIFLKRADHRMLALKGVCTHMECTVVYKPEERRFYCPCHKGWFDEDGKNVQGPPPRPLEVFDFRVEGASLIVYRKGVKVALPQT